MLHERLRLVREMAGLSQRELSRLAGVSEGTVWFVECRPERETATTLTAALAKALGVSLDWLVCGCGDEPTAEAICAAVASARTRIDAKGAAPTKGAA